MLACCHLLTTALCYIKTLIIWQTSRTKIMRLMDRVQTLLFWLQGQFLQDRDLSKRTWSLKAACLKLYSGCYQIFDYFPNTKNHKACVSPTQKDKKTLNIRQKKFAFAKWFCFTTLWLLKSHVTFVNQLEETLQRSMPCSHMFTDICFKFWLFHYIICICCKWLFRVMTLVLT